MPGRRPGMQFSQPWGSTRRLRVSQWVLSSGLAGVQAAATPMQSEARAKHSLELRISELASDSEFSRTLQVF